MPNSRRPTAMKVIAGTVRKDRQTPDAPEFDLVEHFPDPPQHLTHDGAEMWTRLGPQLVSARVLQTVDLYSLEHLCVQWQVFRQKAKAGVESTASEHNALKAAFAEFGMTPASRCKVQSGTKAKSNAFSQNGKRGA